MSLTLGNKGYFFKVKDETRVVLNYQVNVIDTTVERDEFLWSIIYKIMIKIMYNEVGF